MSCYCKCLVALPHGVVGWSAVCDCGISFTRLGKGIVLLTIFANKFGPISGPTEQNVGPDVDPTLLTL